MSVSAASALDAVPREVRDALARAVAPLSPCQERTWRLQHAQPATPYYERIGLRFSGPLDAAVVRDALVELVRRHAILRSVFAVIGGRPMQCVRPRASAPLWVVDLDALAPASRERALTRLSRRSSAPPFDLRRGPLMQATIVRAARTDHVLLLRVHHLAFDGWSRGVLMRELALLFAAFSAGRPSPLPPLRRQFADLARRDREPEAVRRREARAAAWARRFGRPAPPATLPLDRPRSARTSHTARIVPFTMTGDTARALRATAEAAGATPFMVFVAGVAIVLAPSSTTACDVTLGVPMANRISTEAEALVGAFANVLPVRLALGPDTAVRELLTAARDATLDAFAHQDVPFDMVLDLLYPGREKSSYGAAGEEPLFRVCVDFSSAPGTPPATVAGLTVGTVDADDPIAGCDVYITLNARGDSLGGLALYSAELFDPPTVERFLRTLLGVLDAMPRARDRRFADFCRADS